MECVYESACSFLGGLSSLGVSFIGVFTVQMFAVDACKSF